MDMKIRQQNGDNLVVPPLGALPISTPPHYIMKMRRLPSIRTNQNDQVTNIHSHSFILGLSSSEFTYSPFAGYEAIIVLLQLLHHSGTQQWMAQWPMV